MTDWVIKILRVSAVILGLGTVSGGAFYLTNNNEKQTISTVSTKEESDTLIKIEDLQSISTNNAKERPLLQACKKKWDSKDWKPENDKFCSNLYVAKDEREQFYFAL